MSAIYTSILIMTTAMNWSISNSDPPVIVNKAQLTNQIVFNQFANTPCITLNELDPELKSKTTDAFTLYRDEVRFKRYKEALDLWKIAYFNAPGANGKVTYHFDDGIKIYDYLFKNSTGESERQAYVDTIMSIYDKRISCFGDDGTIIARKAFNSYYYYSSYVSSDSTFELFKKVFNKKGLLADYFIVNPFSKMLYDRVLEKKIDLPEARDFAYKIIETIDHGLNTCEGAYCETWTIISEYSPSLLESLEGIKGFYDCNYFMDKYYHEFTEDSTDCDNITKVYLTMRWAGCDTSDIKIINLKRAKDKECYIHPPPPGPLKLAYTALNEGRFNEAIKYYREFIEETNDIDKKAEKLLLISKIYYAHIKNFPMARKYALLASEQRPSWGQPFLLIGKLYASSGPLCGPGRGWDSQIVTWPAIDKFEYAKKIDPTCSSEASEWINRYKKYMPSMEDIFQRRMEKGQRFKVECWIQEWTTIRPAPRQS